MSATRRPRRPGAFAVYAKYSCNLRPLNFRWRKSVLSISKVQNVSGAAKLGSPGALAGQISGVSSQRNDYWELAQRIASSEIFARSAFLPKFLLYVCDRQLAGMTHEITEQQIGERVFGRPPGYSPAEDNIVRNYAAQLRKRLDIYYEHEGKPDAVCISIPRGGYVPVFRLRTALTVEPEIVPSPPKLGENKPAEVVPIVSGRWPLHRNWLMFVLGVACCALLFASAVIVRRAVAKGHTDSPSHVLWSQLFSNSQDTFVVPADSGLGILQNLTEEPAALDDYANGRYLSDVKSRQMDDANLEDLRTQRYTSIADLAITAQLARLPEVIPDRFVVRYARDLRMDDLRNGNAVLLGAIHTDPWVALLQQPLNFQFVCQKEVNECYIVNLHPAAGERQTYASPANNPSQQTFAVIAFLPNLSGTGHLLLVGGLNMAGTQAAADLLLNSRTVPLAIKRATRPDGSLQPFELLVETRSLGAEALPSRIIAARYGP